MRRCPPGLSLKTRLNKYNDIYFALYFVPRIICCSNIPRSVCISSVHRTFWGRKGLRRVKSDWFLFHFLIPSCRESLRQFREMKRLPFLVSLAFINTMFCVRVDFQFRVIFTFVKEIEANGMKGCGWTQKLNPRSTFTATHKPLYIASFIFVRKINARTRVKITRRWKPTLRVCYLQGIVWSLIGEYSALNHALFHRMISTFIWAYEEWRSKGTGESVCFELFFFIKLACWRVNLSLWRKMQIRSSSGLFVLFSRLHKVNFVSVSQVD